MPTLYWMKTSEAFPDDSWLETQFTCCDEDKPRERQPRGYLHRQPPSRTAWVTTGYVDLKCGGHLLRTKEPAPSFRTGTDQKRSRPLGHGDLGADADILRQDLNGNVRIGYLPAGHFCTVEVPLHEEDSDRTKARE
jgi:hypothetical protein